MQRVMIIGGSGSGKSTLARAIGTRLGVPVIHMDSLIFSPGWKEVPEPVFLDRVEAALNKPTWVMDGNYSRTWPQRLARADTVIFLDIPTWLRLWRVIRRVATGYGRTRPDLAPGCPEQIDLGFIFGWVPKYARDGRLKALTLMTDDGPAGHLIRHHLRSCRDVARFLDAL